MTQIVRVLSIAGTDPTGGAGIQADLKSISATGGYGMAVVTALVAQNTHGVRSIHHPPVAFLREQLEAVSDDVTLDAVKIGMLATREVIDEVSAWLDRVGPPIVVLDPVIVATSGDRLLDAAAETALSGLLSRVHIVTPNLPELAVLAHRPVARNWEQACEQGRAVAAAHTVRVLVKGGHLGGALSPDALIDPAGGITEFAAERVPTRNTHGTGCSLSSALATLQARLGDWEQAVAAAKAWLTDSLRHADELEVGSGHGPIHHFAALWRTGRLPGTLLPGAGGTGGTGGVGVGVGVALRDTWWHGIADLRAQIDGLDFIRRLRDGSLPEPEFSFYLAQDALYLRDYSRALARASQLAPTIEEQLFWSTSANGCLAVEMELHRDWLGAGAPQAPIAAVTQNYLNHLLLVAERSSYGTLAAALLPCFWIYQDVGERLAAANHAGHPYNAWLATYADAAFAADTERAIGFVESAATTASAPEIEAMWRAFRASAAHELAFFAMGTAMVPAAAGERTPVSEGFR
ncbi:MAG: bifunctional hydroxymethylpyrimidine kinase/phosphomethylpyrimidine kinase [Cryobacterium sp.]